MDWKRIILQKDKIYYDNFKVYLQYIITFFKIQYQSTINLLNLHLLFMNIYIYIYIHTLVKLELVKPNSETVSESIDNMSGNLSIKNSKWKKI